MMSTTLTLNSRGADVKTLHGLLTKAGYSLPKNEVVNNVYGVGTRNAVLFFQRWQGLRASGEMDAKTLVALEATAALAGMATSRIEGRVYFKDASAAPGTNLSFFSVTLKAELEVESRQADDQGYYALDFDPKKYERIDIRWKDRQNKWRTLSAGLDPKVKHAELDLVLPIASPALPPEHTRIVGDLAKPLGTANSEATIERLSTLTESTEKKELSVLHNATGWDGRLIALNAKAAVASKSTGLSQQALYGMFRVGLPTSEAELVKLDDKSITAALTKASKSGIVAMDDEAIKVEVKKFNALSSERMMSSKPAGALSSAKDMLANSGLSNEKAKTLTALLKETKGEGELLWKALAEKGFTSNEIGNLQVQGKLSFLTFNNATLVASLQTTVAGKGVEALVGKGLYSEAAWEKHLKDMMAAGTAAKELIPPLVPGKDDAERLTNYAKELARKIRISYPTQTAVERVKRNELRLGKEHDAIKQPFIDFLDRAGKQKFELGRTAIGPYLKENADALFTTEAQKKSKDQVVGTVKRFTRLYQITPNDESLGILLNEGLSSALDVVRTSETVFVERYTPSMGQVVATKVYRKARQVHGAAYGIYRSAKQLETAVPTAAMSLTGEAVEKATKAAKDAVVKKYPTLEQLFGSLDFCECEHCRSVLSPAAYLVDLLQYINPKDEEWEAGVTKPFDVLIKRRPDIPHIPLTCENTHTAMPYIDVVLEIMEYHVANGALAAAAAKDTGEATSEELIAEPQYIVEEAYAELNKPRFRPGLPFDLWSETSRAFVDHFDTPLWQVQETLRLTDKLFDDTVGFDRQEIFAEQLELSKEELACFCDPTKLTTWFEFYGFTDAASAKASISSAKELSRRLHITYKELYDLLETRFINPRSHELEVLHRAFSSPSALFSYRGRAGFPTMSAAEKSAFEAAFSALNSTAVDVLTWVNTGYDAGRFDDILVLSDQDAGCDMSKTVVRFADSDPADDLAFLRMALFVRLWRKLGWTMREVDDALYCFLPKRTDGVTGEVFSDVGSVAKLAEGFQTALVYLAHHRHLAGRFKAGKNGRSKWLTLWSDLPSHGKKDQETGVHHLYGHHFLSPNTLQQDAVFDDPAGFYLRSAPQIVEAAGGKDHTSALLAGVGLIVQEVDAVLASKKLARTDGTGISAGHTVAKLDMGTVSMLYRHGFLARVLKLSIPDLLSFIQLSGIDPFPVLQTGKLTTIEEDLIHARTLPFIDMVQRFKARKVKAESIEYWCRHRFDKAGQFVTAAATDQLLVRQLVSAIRASTDAATSEPPLDEELVLDQVAASMASYLGGEQERVRFLLSTPSVMNDPDEAVGTGSAPTRSLFDHFMALTGKGLLQDTFTSQDLTGANSSTHLDLSIPLGIKKADGIGSVRWTCAFEVRSGGEHVFVVDTGGQKDVEGELGVWPVDYPATMQIASASSTGTDGDGSPVAQKIELKVTLDAGRLYWLMLEVKNMQSCAVTPQVRSSTLPMGPLTQLVCYPADAVAKMEASATVVMRVRKALQIIHALALSEAELGWFCSGSNTIDRLDLNTLTVIMDEGGDVRAQALFKGVKRLVDHATLRTELNVTDNALIDLVSLSQGWVGTKEELRIAYIDAFAAITRRAPGDITPLVDHFEKQVDMPIAGATPSLSYPLFQDPVRLQRLWYMVKTLGVLGIPLAVVLRAIDPARDSTSAMDLRNAVKARYEPEAWRRVAGPVFDRLRKKQRDALVMYLLHKLDLDRIEQLYEYFLIDPGMEPVVLTSRIRLATATLQTFIHRSLLNMEPDVEPSAFPKADEWKWKKRYRVWEANRKIFLFPENWLEPEWRDDKSHLFRELESAIFQTDLTAESAEVVYYNYLRKLEEIAKLDVVTTYVEEVANNPDQNTVHVIGRTANLPHKYFYRKQQFNEWSPWEPIDAEIEGDHVVTAVWKDRLYVFWLTFLLKADENANQSTVIEDMASRKTGDASMKQVEVQLNWCERAKGQWSPRASSGFGSPIRFNVLSDFKEREVLVHVTRDLSVDSDRLSVHVHFPKAWNYINRPYEPPTLRQIIPKDTPGEYIKYIIQGVEPGTAGFQLESKLVPPTVVGGALKPDDKFNTGTREATKEFGGGTLSVSFIKETRVGSGGVEPEKTESIPVLGKGRTEYSLVFPSAPLSDVDAKLAPWLNPFFYSDDEHLFFVEPRIAETTVDEWESWVVMEPVPPRIIDIPTVIRETPVWPGKPWVDPVPPRVWDDRFGGVFDPPRDWLNDDRAIVLLNDQAIGRTGSIPLNEILVRGRDRINGPLLVEAVSSLNTGSGGIVDSRGTENLGSIVVGEGGLLGHMISDIRGGAEVTRTVIGRNIATGSSINNR